VLCGVECEIEGKHNELAEVAAPHPFVVVEDVERTPREIELLSSWLFRLQVLGDENIRSLVVNIL
jgi:hypothetical protein